MELEMLVSVSQVSVAQKNTVVRQLAALVHVLDRDIRVRALQERTRLRYQNPARVAAQTIAPLPEQK